MVSCLSGRSRLFPGLPQLCYTSLFRILSCWSISVLSLGSGPQSLRLSTQTSLATEDLQTTSWLKCWLATISTMNSLHFAFCLPRTCCCIPFWGSEAPHCPHPWWGVWVCKNFASFIAPSLRCTTRLVSFVSTLSCPPLFFLLLFSYCFMWRLSCLFGSLRSSDSIQQVFCSCSTCSCIFDVLGEEDDPHVLLLCNLQLFLCSTYKPHFLIHSSIDRWLGCFYILTIANYAAMKIEVYLSFELVFSYSFEIYPEVE